MSLQRYGQSENHANFDRFFFYTYPHSFLKSSPKYPFKALFCALLTPNHMQKNALKSPLEQKNLKKVGKSFGGNKISSYLCTRKTENVAPLAQLVEQLTLNQWV